MCRTATDATADDDAAARSAGSHEDARSTAAARSAGSAAEPRSAGTHLQRPVDRRARKP